jgi:hypothetical protein
MNQVDLLPEALATIVYPGLAAIGLLWVHVGVARWWRSRRMSDLLWVVTATFATATFVLLSLSTGLFILFDFLQLRLAIRFGWLATLLSSIWLTVEYLRRQHANYQQRK